MQLIYFRPAYDINPDNERVIYGKVLNNNAANIILLRD